MISSLKTRLGRLEVRAGVAGRQWVLKVPDGMDTDDALAKLDLMPADSDMVVVLRSFGHFREPALVATHAIGRS